MTFSEKGDNILNAAKVKFCKKQRFDFTQGEIAFNKRRLNTSQLLHPVLRIVSLREWFCAVVSNIASQLIPFFLQTFSRMSGWGAKNWPISRMGYNFLCKFLTKRGSYLNTWWHIPPGQCDVILGSSFDTLRHSLVRLI